VVHRAYEVRIPKAELNDFIVQVRASTLNRIRAKLGEMEKGSFPWHELALAVCTLAFGGWFSALLADFRSSPSQAVVFNTVLPAVGAASLMAYIFLRKSTVDVRSNAADVLNELPDPKRTG